MKQYLQRPKPHGLRNFQGVYTNSRAMLDMFFQLEKVSRSDCPVLIVGETGTGRETVARAIHALGDRRRASFETVNCAALGEASLELDLFGDGGDSDAVDSAGAIARADGGSLYLDEVAELPLSVQSHLLGFLEDGSSVRGSAGGAGRSDARVLSSTSSDPGVAVEQGSLREDLRYRLGVVMLPIPPLRDRNGDVPALFWHFLEELRGKYREVPGSISEEAMKALEAWNWPGNLRELRNAVERAVVMCRGDKLGMGDLPPELLGAARTSPPPVVISSRVVEPAGSAGLARDLTPVQEQECNRLMAALSEARGHRGKAAESLGMSRSTLWRKLGRYGLS
jgi:two-component system response regulator AtoC